jgi:hypothetical protein
MSSPYLPRLLSLRNADGGWGYYPGKASRIEPTSLALMALSASGVGQAFVGQAFVGQAFRPADKQQSVVGQAFSPADKQQPVVTQSVVGQAFVGQAFRPADSLSSFPTRDHLLLDPGADVPNLAFNAQAALALLAAGDAPRARAIVDALLAAKGVTVPNTDAIRQDNSCRWAASACSGTAYRPMIWMRPWRRPGPRQASWTTRPRSRLRRSPSPRPRQAPVPSMSEKKASHLHVGQAFRPADNVTQTHVGQGFSPAFPLTRRAFVATVGVTPAAACRARPYDRSVFVPPAHSPMAVLPGRLRC